MRQQWRGPNELPWAIDSVKMWKTLAEELDRDIEYVQTGHFFIIDSEEEVEDMKKVHEFQRKHGLECHLLSPSETLKIAPFLKPNFVSTSYCPTDGNANPFLVVSGYAAAASRLGARIMRHTEVTDLETKDNEILGVVTNEGIIKTNTVVNAAGVWSNNIGQKVNVTCPIFPSRQHIMVTEPFPRIIEGFFTRLSTGLYFRQAASNTLNIGLHLDPHGPWSVHLEKKNIVEDFRGNQSFDLTPGSKFIPEICRRFLNTVRWPEKFGMAKVVRNWVGLYQMSPDIEPIMDENKDLKRYIVVTGFSGRGFALGPIVGKLLSELVIDRKTSLDISRLSLNRFNK